MKPIRPAGVCGPGRAVRAGRHDQPHRPPVRALFSAAPDLSNIGAPVVAGFVAEAVGTRPMFAIIGVGSLLLFGAGEAAVGRWRARTAPRRLLETAS